MSALIQVLVKEDQNEVLTEKAKSRLKNSVIRFKEEEEDGKILQLSDLSNAEEFSCSQRLE